MVNPPTERHTASKPDHLYPGCRVSRLMGLWHPEYLKCKHEDMVLYGTVINSTGYCSWNVSWDNGTNSNGFTSYSSNVLTIHNGDGDGMVKVCKKSATKKKAGTKLSNKTSKKNKTNHEDPWKSVLQGIHTSPTAKKQPVPSPESFVAPLVTPTKRSLTDRTDRDKFRYLELMQVSTSFDEDDDVLNSSSTLSQETCHPTPEELLKAKQPNVPNDCDGAAPVDNSDIIERYENKSELSKWKEEALKMIGKVITITYDKKKNLGG